METSVQQPDQAGKKSFYHTAANASILAVLLVFVISGILSGAETGAETKGISSLICSITIFLIALVGFVAGIIAFCGIRKHGTKGILVKAIVGVLVFPLLMAIAIPSFLAAKKTYVQRQLSAIVEHINQKCPITTEQGVRLDGAEFLPPKTLLQKHTTLTQTAEEVSPSALTEALRPKLLAAYKADPSMQVLRENGVTIIFQYRDKNGKMIGDVTVGPDCLAQ